MVTKGYLEHVLQNTDSKISEYEEKVRHYQNLLDDWRVCLENVRSTQKECKERLENGEYDE